MGWKAIVQHLVPSVHATAGIPVVLQRDAKVSMLQPVPAAEVKTEVMTHPNRQSSRHTDGRGAPVLQKLHAQHPGTAEGSAPAGLLWPEGRAEWP